MEIDFVVTWVDMDDPKWKEEFNRYCGKIDNSVNELSEARFRDHGFLKYWFRGVDTFAPWVRKIHFVTSGQHPVWLNTDHTSDQGEHRAHVEARDGLQEEERKGYFVPPSGSL